MRVVVCLKPIDDYSADNSPTVSISQTYCRAAISQQDLVALEEALILRERWGGEVTVLCLGTGADEGGLRRALIAGADKAILVQCEVLGHADWQLTSFLLSRVVGKLGFDLILCGTKHSGEMEEAVGPGIAEYLRIPLVANAVGIEVAETNGEITLQVSKKLPRGIRESYEVRLPCVVTVTEGLSQPRYVPILGRLYRQGLLKPIENLPISSLGVEQTALVPKTAVLGTCEVRPRVRVGVKVSGLPLEEKLRLLNLVHAQLTGGKELIVHDHQRAANRLVEKLAEWLGGERA